MKLRGSKPCTATRKFVLGQPWCLGLGEFYFGKGLGGVVAVFLMEMNPRPPDVDQWLWVIVGDLPPAYLVADEAKTPIQALEIYIDLMGEWVSCAYEGRTSADVIPVNLPPTPQNAALLEKRLDTLRDEIVPWLERDPASE